MPVEPMEDADFEFADYGAGLRCKKAATTVLVQALHGEQCRHTSLARPDQSRPDHT